MEPPKPSRMQLAFWVELGLAQRFQQHCEGINRRQREVAEDAIAFYLEHYHRAAATTDAGVVPSSVASTVRGLDSHDGGKEE